MQKKSEKKNQKNQAIVEVNLEDLSEKAGIAGLKAKTILSYVVKNDIEGLEKAIATAEAIKAEREAVDALIQNSGLNKQALNILGLTVKGQWNAYTDATTKWLLPIAQLMLSDNWKAFINSDRRLSDYEKLIPVFKKEK